MTHQKGFRDFEIRPKFSETQDFLGTIRHPSFGAAHTYLAYTRAREYPRDPRYLKHAGETNNCPRQGQFEIAGTVEVLLVTILVSDQL